MKGLFLKMSKHRKYKGTKNYHAATRMAGVTSVQCFKQVKIGAREGGEEQGNTSFGDKLHSTHI